MHPDLQNRLEEFRNDYALETGQAFEHFFCPILLRDEPAELCEGHVIPAALRSGNKWVPQRTDVDNFFGRAVEAELAEVIEAKEKGAYGVLVDRKLQRRFQPRIESEGSTIEHYFVKPSSAVPNHTPVRVATDQGQHICDIIVKKTPSDIQSLVGAKIHLVVEADCRAAAIATTLKAAHLSMFRMLGYRHVFSPAGQNLAHVLGQFYLANQAVQQPELKKAVDSYFLPLSPMVAPLLMEDESLLLGTLFDNCILTCHSAGGGVFAVGVIVKAGGESFCVFLPGDGPSMIDVYFSFLHEPPVSIMVRVARFVPACSKQDAQWTTEDAEPFCLTLTRS